MKNGITEFESELRLMNAQKRRAAIMPAGDGLDCLSMAGWLAPDDSFIQADEIVCIDDCSTLTLATIRLRMKANGLATSYVDAEIKAREERFGKSMQLHVDAIISRHEGALLGVA